MTDEKFLTPQEVSTRYKGVSEQTLAIWRHRGKGPRYTKAGGKVLYPLDGLEEWEKSRTHGGGTSSESDGLENEERTDSRGTP
jgi:hypothetical protein